MKKLFMVVFVLLAVFFSFPAARGGAEASPRDVEFSAEFVENDGGEITKGKIYIGNGMSRFETAGGREIIVTRRDQKVIWLIFPQLSRYVEQEYIGEPQQIFIDPTVTSVDNLEREFIDYEWIDSYRLRKFLVTAKYPSGDEDKYYEWFRDNFPVPVKTASLDGKTSFEYQRIKIGAQDPALFVTPKRYKKVTMEEIIVMEKSAEDAEHGKKK